MKITLKNYPTAAQNADTSVFNAEQAEMHTLLLEFGEEVVTDPRVQEQVDVMLDLLNSHNGGSQAHNPAAEVKPPKAPRTPKAATDKKPRAPRAPKAAPKATAPATPKKAGQAAKEVAAGNVRGISIAVSLIRGFMQLVGKQVPGSRVTAKMRAVQQAMLDGRVHAGQRHAKEVDEVQDLLIKAVNGLKTMEHPDKLVMLELDNDDTKAKLVGIAGGEDVFGSVAVLKAFVKLSGKKVSKTQIANLLKRTEGSKIKAGDPFQGELKEIQALLKKAKPDAILNAASVGLSGTRASRMSELAGLVRAIDRHTPKHRTSAKKKARPVVPQRGRPDASPRKRKTTARR